MSTVPSSQVSEGDYTWEVATLFPEHGEWSEEEYLRLTDGMNRRIEFTDGRLEFLATPTDVHETLIEFLFFALHAFVEAQQCGKVRWTGIRLRIRPRKIRLPDVIFLHKNHFHVRHNRAWDGADLVMEVVGEDPKDRQRDYEEKPLDYAEAKVTEYWIVDYERQLVIVHSLDGDHYKVSGEFARGQQAASSLLAGFAVDVEALFAAADEVPE